MHKPPQADEKQSSLSYNIVARYVMREETDRVGDNEIIYRNLRRRT